ncbi:glucoamylase family protein [Mesorhizobium sp.]|uniref:GH36-type glycosyl hydrolase domain-containing protein n=1 Tax=Mesorhizobium sp. TaxID=1871066 RepID=UPI00120355BC|nr:glucoamylase family protein [Mesorhizobium sp.]TIO77185.1 MAG: cellobiose phosphorylase [Mesorhizobium sp.]
MTIWLQQARAVAANPSPDAAKAAEWLLDNTYHVERAVRQIAQDLPSRFYRGLPSLGNSREGVSRIFAVAYGLIDASHLQLSLASAIRFIQVYQEGAPLTVAELWALPTMLRLACLEILVCGWARLFPNVKPPFEPTHHAQICDVFDGTECVSRALANLITISSISWKDFVDRTCLVEAILGDDPGGFYSRSEFETRDRYRKAVEEIALRTGQQETEVARRAIALACQAKDDSPRDHVGYWLIGDGRSALESPAGVLSLQAWRRSVFAHVGVLYGIALVAFTAIALSVPAIYLAKEGAGPGAWLLGVVLAMLPASMVGTAMVNWIVALIVPPRVLPKLDFGKGISADCATAVAIPAIIGAADEVPALMERLEQHRLANRDLSLRFVLLSDHADAPSERMPGDDEAEQALVLGIRGLNERYGQDSVRPFHLLHRPRRFNSSEGNWMGRERKRGSLEEFDHLILSNDANGFSRQEGDQAALGRIRFVVTVDADTTLAPGSVARLVGTLAHPLNTARFDEKTDRVAAGFTALRPRVEISPDCGSRSLFARLYAGNSAIDIHTRAVSDVYQDLFGSGIYVGQGIYEVAALRRSLERQGSEIARNHDLIDGIYGRVALASDIVVYEDFPDSYIEFARRRRRRVREIWQLLPWLARKVPGAGGVQVQSRLAALDRWKILDNLRGSLVPLSLLLLAAAGWLGLPGSAWIWTVLIIVLPGAYLSADPTRGLAPSPRPSNARIPLCQIDGHWGRWLLAIIFLAHDATMAVDAITRTLWRLFVSRRYLHVRTLAARTPNAINGRSARAATWHAMWPTSALVAAMGLAVGLVSVAALVPAAPLLLLWFAAPEIAVWFSCPRSDRMEELGADDRAFLRRLARRTWLYFERFAGPADNWLPPDNVQDETEVAHRTSPTNIGMMFLSSLAALDIGYASPTETAARIRNGLDTLDRLERWRGHFLNWYDTRLLRPLESRYVSTVDSGNLAVCLVTLKKGCEEAVERPALRREQWDGLADTLDLLGGAKKRLPGGEGSEFGTCMAAIIERVAHARDDGSVTSSALGEICEQAFPKLQAAVADAVEQSPQASAEALKDIQTWLERTRHHIDGMRRDLEALAPWILLLEKPPPGREGLAHELAAVVAISVPMTQMDDRCDRARVILANAKVVREDGAEQWFSELETALERGARNQAALREELLRLAQRCEALAFAMDFRPLFDPERRLFRVGYHVSGDRPDSSHYDLLASEARLASYFAIAKGDVSFEHWLFLGRPMTRTAEGLSLLSWGGSMFEYLMPTLLVRSGPQTLLGQSERQAVEAQRRYARRHGVPWGISESAYSLRDADHRYRYRGFGVPELGLRRGSSRDLVIAPYATALALAVRRTAAVTNLRDLERLGLVGRYGLIEAGDFTPERVTEGTGFSPVQAFMAHHQGMVLAALDNALCDKALVRRFRADPRMRAAELLLQERVPWEQPPEIRAAEERETLQERRPMPALQAWVPQAAADFPQLLALGNGRLASWISEAGGGGLSWHGQSLTRWLPDPTRDQHGLWIYVRDEEDGSVWSIGRQPSAASPEEARIVFHPHMAEFHRRDHGVGLRMEVGVVHGDDLEIRRISVVNESERPRHLRFTTYGEVVLADQIEDERHPAFSKLFVGSEYLPGMNGLLFMRRPRRPEEKPAVLLHRVLFEEPGIELAGFETDRRVFLGRNGDARRPRAIREVLSGATGWTLDPVMALDVRVDLGPQERRQFAFLTLAAESRESLLASAERYGTLASLEWGLNDAAAKIAIEAGRLGLEPARLPELQLLASLLAYRHPSLRAAPDAITGNRLGQPTLWALGISGDHPILLVHVRDSEGIDLLRTLIAGHLFWRRGGIEVDLVVLHGGASGYGEPLRERFAALLDDAGIQQPAERGGRIHLILSDQIREEERCLIEAAAQVVLDASKGPLARQLAPALVSRLQPPRFEPNGVRGPGHKRPAVPRATDLLFDNGFGGFSVDGSEYVIYLGPGGTTPAPWCNVLANERFGTIVTEAGSAFTWSLNSGENRLTPWSNDPVADPPGEVLYLRDEETAEIWTPTPRPAGEGTSCEIRHGSSYTIWRHVSHEIEHELLVFVPVNDPVKIARLKLRNLEGRTRRITATYYAEWLLGGLRSTARPLVVCDYDPASHSLFARNPWNPDFAERTAFLTSSLPPHSVTTDRLDFVGRDGNLAAPAGLKRWDLGGRVGPGGEPCAAFQVYLEIGAGKDAEVVFVLGQGDNRDHAQQLARRWQSPSAARSAFETLAQYWNGKLGAVRVKTPDPAFDLMVNRWLPYQTLASRILARAGFHQAGGAMGFRDQLQDVLALLHAEPARARAHILGAAAQQFEEGDVLHWWHPPPDNRGLRTRCSDDPLWLPYVTGCYVEATGDVTILREEVPFLSALPLKPEEEDRYARFDAASKPRPLFEHCERALDHGVTCGVHDLPLIGSGDWNDGMNRIGRAGRGESVWLAWFAIAAIRHFAALCSRTGHNDLAKRWLIRAGRLEQAIGEAAWDGKWYLRAFDDEGHPVGSVGASECRIDSIAQSWAVLAGGSASPRARTAMESTIQELSREQGPVLCLLWPPFDATSRDPGYIKAYPPGIRENGGQYCHAAAWLGHAFARLGDGERARQIFDLLNPIRRTSIHAEADRYRVEPYVMAADIASVAPHAGQGGWTWYTGSAAWTWRLGVEAILGLRLQEGRLLIDPCLPKDWGLFEAEIRGANGSLMVRVEDPEGIGKGHVEMTVDGIRAVGATVAFPADGSMRRVGVRLRRATPKAEGP